MVAIPPIEKVYEAWSAIADNRINLISGSFANSGEAEVVSSNGEKTYLINWDGNKYTSNDNATWWHGYTGYPVIAIMMLQGRLPLDRDHASLFKNIDWNELNRKAHGNYAEALEMVMANLKLPPDKEAEIRKEAMGIVDKLAGLDIQLGRYKKLPHGDY